MKVHASGLLLLSHVKDYLENGEERLTEAKSKAGRVLGKMVTKSSQRVAGMLVSSGNC